MASNPASLACEHCGETFLRREHRDRHLRRHSGVKPFQCDVCHKSFARRYVAVHNRRCKTSAFPHTARLLANLEPGVRSDTLVRHRNLHRHEDQTRSTPRRCAQACLSCARLKQRCPGGLPCARCQDTGTECMYSSAKAASPQGLISPRTSATPASLIGAPSAPHFDRRLTINDNPDLVGAVPATNKPAQPAEPHISQPGTITPASNRHDTSSSFPVQATHLITAPAVLPSSSVDCPAFDIPDLWDPSLFLYGSPGLGEFTPEWDALAAYFPLCPASEGLGEVPGTEYNSANRNHQRGNEVHSSSQALHLRSQATSAASAQWQHQTAPDRPSGPALVSQSTTVFRLDGDSPCRRFPQTQGSHMQMAETESFGHVRNIPSRAYEEAQKFYAIQCRDATACFIPMRLIRAFVDLYFEYFDPQFPFLHVSRLEAEELPWILLLATAAIGSNYSGLDGIREYTSILCDLLDRAVDQEVRGLLNPTRFLKLTDGYIQAVAQITTPTKPLIQCVFLRHVHFTSCGLHKKVLFVQHKRYMLVAMCRDLMARKKAERTTASISLAPLHEWDAWLATEEEIRLVCCVYSQFIRLASRGYSGTNESNSAPMHPFLVYGYPHRFQSL